MSALKSVEDKSPQIITTHVEHDFFDLCLDAAARAGKGTVIRVAGGWVRDKLLGHSNDDIDLAVDNVSGEVFGRHLNEHLAALKREMKQGGKSQSGRISPNGVKVAVIKANPDQSKHLETATVKVAGLEVDITNLRTETYSEDSRIPEMQFGTAEQDAFRRDLTINALFYNVTTGLVEDLTGRGLDDLRAGRVTTPLPPFETFRDDPLRVLRAVRFSHRFNFRMDPAIADAAGHPAIVEALVCKVSRERFGKELEGMLKRWRSFPAAVRELHGMGLLPLLLTTDAEATAQEAQEANKRASLDQAASAAATSSASGEAGKDSPALATPASGEGSGGSGGGGAAGVSQATTAPGRLFSWEASLDSLDWLALLLGERAHVFLAGQGCCQRVEEREGAASTTTKAGATQVAPVSDGERAALARASLLAGMALPFAGAKVMTGKKRNKPQRAAGIALQEGLKLRNKDCDDSAAIVEAQPRFAALASRLRAEPTAEATAPSQQQQQQQPLRVELGLLLRDLKALWRPALALSTATALQAALGPIPTSAAPVEGAGEPVGWSEAEALRGDGGASSSSSSSSSSLLLEATAARVVAEYESIAAAVASLGLDQIWSEKPLVNGSDLAKALELPPGPAVGQAMKAQVLWQLEHPGGSPEACIAALREGRA